MNMMMQMGHATHRQHRAPNVRPINEREAESALRDAIAEFGQGSASADCARRHLKLICRFNELYGWGAQ